MSWLQMGKLNPRRTNDLVSLLPSQAFTFPLKTSEATDLALLP